MILSAKCNESIGEEKNKKMILGAKYNESPQHFTEDNCSFHRLLKLRTVNSHARVPELGLQI